MKPKPKPSATHDEALACCERIWNVALLLELASESPDYLPKASLCEASKIIREQADAIKVLLKDKFR